MSEVTKYEPGVPCWVDTQSPDLAASSAFYRGLFGWDAEDLGEEAGHYTMFRLRGLDVAALGPLQMEGMPPVWTTYLASDDTDATVKKVEAAGGTVFAPPFDVFQSGRMAVAADPTGAVFGIWQAKQHIGARLVNEPGAFTWNELTVRDIGTALTFYTTVFGFTVNEIEMGTGDATMRYRELQIGGRSVAGAMEMTDQFPPEVPPHWMTYFAVADADASVAKATELGGTVHVPPTDIPPGRFAVLTDPVGAAFSIIKSNPMPGA